MSKPEIFSSSFSPPASLGQGRFFYIFAGVFLGSILLFSILWGQKWYVLGAVGIFWATSWILRLPIPILIISLLACWLSILSLESAIQWANSTYSLGANSIDSKPSTTSIFIEESLWVKGGRLVLIGHIEDIPIVRVMIRILPSNNIPSGSTIFRITSKSPPSKFQVSRWIYMELEASIQERLWGIPPIKTKLSSYIESLLPYPESALMAGILIGDASLMDDNFNARFRRIGLTHLCVVSGSNISFVLVNLCILLFFIPFQYRIPLAICGIISYILLVGTDPPVLRAGVMGIVGVFSLLYGKRGDDQLRLLTFAATGLVLLSPMSLVYDIGFLLSFLATLGIIVGGEVTRGRGRFTELWSGSIFAAIWTLPISIGAFGTLHSMSVLANIIVAPFVGIATTLAFLTLVFSPVSSFISYHLGHLSFLSLAFIDTIARVFGNLPYQFQVEGPLKAIICLLGVWAIIGFSLRFLSLRGGESRVVSRSPSQ